MGNVWDRDVLTGVAPMDGEHLGLLGTLSTLRAAIDAGQGTQLAQSLLDRFDADIRTHFAEEEREMESLGYPQSSSHVAQHQRFLEELTTLRERCRAGDVELTAQLVEFVETWFIRHIEIADQPLSAWLAGR